MIDINIINMSFEYSYMDTISNVEYPDLDTNKFELL